MVDHPSDDLIESTIRPTISLKAQGRRPAEVAVGLGYITKLHVGLKWANEHGSVRTTDPVSGKLVDSQLPHADFQLPSARNPVNQHRPQRWTWPQL